MAATRQQIIDLYHQHLGPQRDPSEEEIQGWLDGSFGPNPASQIPESGEAQQYKASQGQSGAPPDSGDWWTHNGPGRPGLGAGGTAGDGTGGSAAPGSDEAISAKIAEWSRLPGANPSLARDPQYWLRRINETGGLRADNEAFWRGLAMRPEGAPEGSGGPSGPLGGNRFTGYGGGDPAGFGTPPRPYQSAPYGGGQYTTPSLPSWLQTPFTPATYTSTTFTPPTGIDLQNDPGYLARMRLANEGLERSAAARGSVLSGGFQQELAKYNQDYASNEYGNVYNRALGTFQTNTGNAFNAFNANTANQFGARQQQQGEYQMGVGNAQTQYGNRYNAYLNDQQRMLNDYLTNYNIGHTAETDYWGRLRDLHGSGLNAALGSRVQ